MTMRVKNLTHERLAELDYSHRLLLAQDAMRNAPGTYRVVEVISLGQRTVVIGRDFDRADLHAYSVWQLAPTAAADPNGERACFLHDGDYGLPLADAVRAAHARVGL